MSTVILPVLAYCFGSICSAILVCRFLGLPDPASTGSNNPGATNVLRIGGKKAAIITLVCDVLKGWISIMVAKMFAANPMTIALVGMAAFLGHLYPVFFGFKGGKGVATAAGVFIGLSGTLTLILVGIWLLMAILFRYSSLAALTAAALAPFLVLWSLDEIWFFPLAAFIAVLLFWRHRENIKRLLAGNEGKINLRKD